uniref:Uncharacterized protein n=1 Tax=Megaviridae environmental sample TaxID=1737588 RepID=A0A5J6VMY7_9VIRU|nr:MAG: hypothetical protein [Megaviridae environmental sample]
MNYFTHSTIILILAIIILLVLLIYTNYLDKSKKVKKQVMLKLDRDEPTQDPSTAVSNNTNHWSDNQLYLHSFSEPLEQPSRHIEKHIHPSSYDHSQHHIEEVSSIPAGKGVISATSEEEAEQHSLPVIKETTLHNKNVKDHFNSVGEHTHYDIPSGAPKDNTISASQYSNYQAENSAPRSRNTPSAPAKKKSTDSKKNTGPYADAKSIVSHAKKTHCNKMKCTTKVDPLGLAIEQLVANTTTSKEFATIDRSIPAAKNLIQKSGAATLSSSQDIGVHELDTKIQKCLFGTPFAGVVPGYSSTDSGLDQQTRQSLLSATHDISTNTATQVDFATKTTQKLISKEDHTAQAHDYYKNKILQIVKQISACTSLFVHKQSYNNIIGILKMVPTIIDFYKNTPYYKDWRTPSVADAFITNYNSFLHTIQSKQFLCDMEDLYKLTTYRGFNSISPFNINGFIKIINTQITKIINHDLSLKLKKCIKKSLHGTSIFAIVHPNTIKQTVKADFKLLSTLQEATKQLKNNKFKSDKEKDQLLESTMNAIKLSPFMKGYTNKQNMIVQNDLDKGIGISPHIEIKHGNYSPTILAPSHIPHGLEQLQSYDWSASPGGRV